MLLYWPESIGEQIDRVGYNHAVMLLRDVLGDRIVSDPKLADYRMYCNLPWHDDPKGLKADGLPIMAYTMYESTRVPSAWVGFLNRHCEIVVVPSEWCREVFRRSGVKRPIYIVSLGIDSRKFRSCWKEPNRGPYRFLWQGVAYDPGGRKGVDVAVRAFKELKQGGLLKPEDELVLKFRPYERSRFSLEDVRSPMGIRYVQQDMDRNRLMELYDTVDCCIAPTRGEGFGLIPLEQMAMAKPVIVTRFSIPYLDAEVCLPLKYKLVQSPVVWNHRHLVASMNGISFNSGGLQTDICWMPKMLEKKHVGVVPMLTPKGLVDRKTTIREEISGRISRVIAGAQKVTGLYRKTRKPVTLYQEYPGEDAQPDVEHLKERMMWCYQNREVAADIGFLAREYATRSWDLQRMRDDIEALEQELRRTRWARR